jgi:hypothetical protein
MTHDRLPPHAVRVHDVFVLILVLLRRDFSRVLHTLESMYDLLCRAIEIERFSEEHMSMVRGYSDRSYLAIHSISFLSGCAPMILDLGDVSERVSLIRGY